jgi:PAS domain-containing protein
VSGEWRLTWVRARPLRDADGSVRGWVGMNIDLTAFPPVRHPGVPPDQGSS